MGYCVDEIVSWYQKKIGAYDKQQWETTVEQRILNGFTHVPKKTAKLKTELIDVDLVRGSAFSKTKPKHGVLTVLRLAVVRLILLPFYTGWWSKQTCVKFSVLLLLLYVLQIVNTFLYFTFISSDDTNERVSASEVLVPFVMMLVLTVIHSLIICTSPSSPTKCSLDSQNSGRRVRRTKRRSVATQGSLLRSVRNAGVATEQEPVEETKYSKRHVHHNSSSEEGAEIVTRPRRVVVWDTTPVKTKSPPPPPSQPNQCDPDLIHPQHRLREQLAGVDRMHVPADPESPPPQQDDDGFESLNGNEGSSDNNEEEPPPPPCDSNSVPDCDSNSSPRTPQISLNNDEEQEVLQITISAPTPPRRPPPPSYLPWGFTCCQVPGSTQKRGPQRSVDVIVTATFIITLLLLTFLSFEILKEPIASFSSGESHGSFCPGLTEGTTSAGELFGITTNSEECSYSDVSSGGERQLLGGNMETDLPFAWELEHVTVNSTLGLVSTWTDFVVNAAFSNVMCERYVILIGLLERLILGGFFFFLLTVAERTFKQRFLLAKFFSHLTSFRRARKSELPHFRLNKVRNIKTWLSVRSYLRKRGPQRSVDVIVTATFIITLLLLTFLSFEILKDSFRLHSTINVEALVWCLMLGVFLLRFMTLGTKINHKYRNMSVLITEQINLYLQIEQKPNKKDELMLANSVLKLAADLLKELESPFKISGLSANPYLYTITKVCILSALSGVLSELLGFKLKLHKIKIK
ncbi:putative homeodomain transcription factor [Diaphorina citri]|uniref:Homeodomain transcription factor n=1 Tax=Diaphorina citri TaxID=121845 RepID=A0A3Q0IXU1_DIACI|nr:putative homeodomain transcription factor [Diaphorina citri]